MDKETAGIHWLPSIYDTRGGLGLDPHWGRKTLVCLLDCVGGGKRVWTHDEDAQKENTETAWTQEPKEVQAKEKIPLFFQ